MDALTALDRAALLLAILVQVSAVVWWITTLVLLAIGRPPGAQALLTVVGLMGMAFVTLPTFVRAGPERDRLDGLVTVGMALFVMWAIGTAVLWRRRRAVT